MRSIELKLSGIGLENCPGMFLKELCIFGAREAKQVGSEMYCCKCKERQNGGKNRRTSSHEESRCSNIVIQMKDKLLGVHKHILNIMHRNSYVSMMHLDMNANMLEICLRTYFRVDRAESVTRQGISWRVAMSAQSRPSRGKCCSIHTTRNMDILGMKMYRCDR